MIYSIKEVKMKVEKFKNLIKESIKEVLVEEGLLKEVISTVMKESQQFNVHDAAETMKHIQELQMKVASRKKEEDVEVSEKFDKQLREHEERAAREVKKMQDLREKMMSSIGKSSYKDIYSLEGVDLFEGTTPLSRGGSPGESASSQGPLSGIEPDDAGVSIDSLLGNKKLWEQLIKK